MEEKSAPLGPPVPPPLARVTSATHTGTHPHTPGVCVLFLSFCDATLFDLVPVGQASGQWESARGGASSPAYSLAFSGPDSPPRSFSSEILFGDSLRRFSSEMLPRSLPIRFLSAGHPELLDEVATHHSCSSSSSCCHFSLFGIFSLSLSLPIFSFLFSLTFILPFLPFLPLLPRPQPPPATHRSGNFSARLPAHRMLGGFSENLNGILNGRVSENSSWDSLEKK